MWLFLILVLNIIIFSKVIWGKNINRYNNYWNEDIYKFIFIFMWCIMYNKNEYVEIKLVIENFLEICLLK